MVSPRRVLPVLLAGASVVGGVTPPPGAPAVTVDIDWGNVTRALATSPALQVVVNPLITRGSPVHDAVYGSLHAMTVNASNLGPLRFVPWLPYPRLGVGELEPPSGSALCGFRSQEGTAFPLALTCPAGVISAVTFASFGTPSGFCGSLAAGTCNAPASVSTVSAACLGKASCILLPTVAFFGGVDPCPGTPKQLAVQVACSAPVNVTYWDFTDIDPLVEDFMAAADGADVIINFSTPPNWLYVAPRVWYPDDPDGETWGYEQGTALVDPTAATFGAYYGRLLAYYTEGGFTDEAGGWHAGYNYTFSHWECLNEVEAEHANTPQSYTRIYDAMTAAMRAAAPRGSAGMQWVGMALEGHDEWDWWSYFLNASNHAAGTPLEWASFHFYASCDNRTDPAAYLQFFPAADAFVTECGQIVALRDALAAGVRLDADELGVILPDDNDPAAPPFPTIYWNAAGAMYAYLFGRLAGVGIDVLGESQLVGYPNLTAEGWPPQFPSVAMLNWTTGAGNARYWVLKLLVDTTAVGDAMPATGIAPTLSSPFCGTTINLANLTLTCTTGVIDAITFADYGTETGTCPAYTRGTCTDPNATAIVESYCLGRATCTVPATTPIFGDPCYGTVKYLTVVATCSTGGGYSPSTEPPGYAQAFVGGGGCGGGGQTRKVLLVNKDINPLDFVVAGAAGGSLQYVDASIADGPPATVPLTSDTITLSPWAVAMAFLP